MPYYKMNFDCKKKRNIFIIFYNKYNLNYICFTENNFKKMIWENLSINEKIFIQNQSNTTKHQHFQKKINPYFTNHFSKFVCSETNITFNFNMDDEILVQGFFG